MSLINMLTCEIVTINIMPVPSIFKLFDTNISEVPGQEFLSLAERLFEFFAAVSEFF